MDFSGIWSSPSAMTSGKSVISGSEHTTSTIMNDRTLSKIWPQRGMMAKACRSVLRLKVVQGVMLALTFTVLYAGEVFVALLDVSYDSVYVSILYICMVVFFVEWILNCIASPLLRPPYNLSLFFWLDVFSALSIGIDILMYEGNDLTDNGPVARAARAARIGTRAGRNIRFMRIVRFVRLVRIVRVMKSMMQWGNKRKTSLQETMNESNMRRADTIGAQMGASTTKKVVCMTLLLLLTLPLLERSELPHLCGGEIVVALRTVSASSKVQKNCTKLRAEVNDWFNAGAALLKYSRRDSTGLTKRGLIYCVVDKCELYRDETMMGHTDERSANHLAQRRRSQEILIVPCDASYRDSDGNGYDARSASYMLYDLRGEVIEDAIFAMCTTTLIVVVLLGFSMLFSIDAERIANQLAVPIGVLMKEMTRTARLDLELGEVALTQVSKSEVYEIRELQKAFVHLHGAVGSFAKFTPLEVVRHFLTLGKEATLGVQPRRVTIFFSDIAGFTTICERQKPEEVLLLLSEYFEEMVSIILEENGTLLEFIGDALLAVWNAPSETPDHAVRAATAALRMSVRLAELRESWSQQGKPEIRNRIGLHTADVYVGNLGSRLRMKYGVLGDGVNLASRLEELNKRYSTEILVSEDMLNQDDMRELFVIRPIDLVVVKGRAKPTAVFEILASRASASEDDLTIASLSEEAFQAYSDRDFAGAIRCLGQINGLKGGGSKADPQGYVLAERCTGFLKNPPPADWAGSEVLKDKTF